MTLQRRVRARIPAPGPVSPGKYPGVAVEITEAEFDALQVTKVERIKAMGGDPSNHTSHQDSWVRKRCLGAV